MLVKDVMTRDVVTVLPETPVLALARRLVEQRISAVPVVDPSGRIVGIVSEGDLMRRRELGTEARRSWWLEMFVDPDALALAYTKAHGLTAADVMASPVHAIEESAPLAAAADMMEKQAVKRLPVTREGTLVGIVSRADLVRALLAQTASAAAPSRADDRSLAAALAERIRAQSWARSTTLNCVVDDGVVGLWGFVRSEEQRRALLVLAQETPGVRGVEDHLTQAHFGSAA
jgi:CBS domain-containing protein